MEIYHVIGLMSGTSLDGLDMAYCQIQKQNNQWKAEILQAETVEYSLEMTEKLANLENESAQNYVKTDIELGNFFGVETHKFIVKNKLKVDFIASHGHTVFHQPEHRIYSQIGYGGEISAQTKLPVVCDFRGLDIAMGGQGAPLVPIGDKLLFSEYDFCLNLGGIANISFDYQGNRIAFDICLANMGLNDIAKKLGKNYDENGNLARSGEFEPKLFDQLNADNFYKTEPPKSLGKEWYLGSVQPILENFSAFEINKLHTLCQHIAYQIGQITKTYGSKSSKMLVTGGGAFNSFLMEKIQEETEIQLIVPNHDLVSYKEALIFAFLGILRVRGEHNCLKKVTGTSYDHSGGVIFQY